MHKWSLPVLLFPCILMADSEWSGNVAFEGQWFAKQPLFAEQSRNNLSLSASPEYFVGWDNENQSLSIQPFFRLDKNDSEQVTKGILKILREGEGDAAARRWADSCSLSGHCIPACDYGVNPRFMLSMARVALAKKSIRLDKKAIASRC